MVDTVNELAHLSKQLNQTSDRLNAVISDLNSKLQTLNLGVEAWCDLLGQAIAPGESSYEGEGVGAPRRFEAHILGYTRIGAVWQLALKNVVVRESKWDSRTGDYAEYEFLQSEPPVPLLKCSRELRVNAIQFLPRLLDELKNEAESILKAVAAAEQLAEKVGQTQNVVVSRTQSSQKSM